MAKHGLEHARHARPGALLLAGLALLCGAQAAGAAEPGYRIGIHYYKSGTIYDEAVQGLRDGLLTLKIPYQEVVLNSKNDDAAAAANLKSLDGQGVDVIYSLSSAGTIIAKDLGLKAPIVATVVNHPVTLGVAGGSGATAARLAGTSYYVEAAKQLGLYRSLFPTLKKVGMLFDAKNPAGYVAEEPFMREACAAAGLPFESVGVAAAAELPAATERLLAARVDVIVVPTNNLVYENLGPVLALTNAARIPVMSMNKQGVEKGALAALFADTYNLGRQAAEMVRKIVAEKKEAASLGFEYIPQPDIIVNLAAAQAIGYQFPDHVLGSAAIVLQ